MKPLFITPSNAKFYDVLREDAAGEDSTNWTVSRHARRGDRVAVYICAPVAAVVAEGLLASDPARDEDPHSLWLGHYLADVENLRLLDRPVRRATLLALFPLWRYWKQPHASVRVPEDYLAEMEMLLRGETLNRRRTGSR